MTAELVAMTRRILICFLSCPNFTTRTAHELFSANCFFNFHKINGFWWNRNLFTFLLRDDFCQLFVQAFTENGTRRYMKFFISASLSDRRSKAYQPTPRVQNPGHVCISLHCNNICLNTLRKLLEGLTNVPDISRNSIYVPYCYCFLTLQC